MEVNDISVCTTKLTLNEQETLLRYDAIEKKWYVDTTVQKHITSCASRAGTWKMNAIMAHRTAP